MAAKYPKRVDQFRFFETYIGLTATYQKHPSFESEAELRLIVPDMEHYPHRVSFRRTRSSLVPYVELHLPEWSKEALSFPETNTEGNILTSHNFIHSVTVGPTPNMTLSVNALRSLFFGLKQNVQIRPSVIPYRDW